MKRETVTTAAGRQALVAIHKLVDAACKADYYMSVGRPVPPHTEQKLDCAWIEMYHALRAMEGEA